MCFSGHLLEAISTNKGRADYYSSRSNGLSLLVSKELIKNERILLLTAIILDLQAQQFINKKIPVICGDFVDMRGIRQKEEYPIRNNIAATSTTTRLKAIFVAQREKMEISNKENDFSDISSRAADMLRVIEKIEGEEQSNFCMSKHVVESIGYAALHAVHNSKLSGGRADGLLSKFIGAEIKGLSEEIVVLDENAQHVHALGIGIVCNDVPKIPFLEEWQNES